MPCSQHNHKPWPTNGVHILRIEACERECGWCNAKSTSATNLRSHARKHLNNANATPLHNITIFSGKAGRKRVELATQLLAEQQQNDKLDSSVEKLDSNTDVCPSSNERVSTTTRVQDGHNDTFERSSQSLASMALNQDLNRVGKVGKDIDDASKHSSSAQIPDQYAPVAPITLDYAEQGHTLHSYQDVRSEIRELEKSIRRCSARLRAFVANLPPHFPTVHRYGVDSFITWCSLTSSSMLSLHEYFDERHIERPLVSAHESNLRKRSIGLAGTTMSHNEAQLSVPTSNIRVSTENYHCTPLKAIALASTPNYTTRAMMFQPSKGFSEETSQGRLDSSEQLKFTVHHEADLSRQQQLPSIGSLLSADQNDVASETLAESAPLVQLRYDSTARSINLTRTGRISKAKKGLKVHSCECGRSYTRIEHLRRHQKNHTSEDSLMCDFPSCGKIFYRPDLLLRHQERHQEPQEEPALLGCGSPTHQSSSSHWLDLGSPTDVFDFFSEPIHDLFSNS